MDLLKRARERYEVRVVAYVLTPNHVHLLVWVGEIPLGRGTQFLQGDFAQWYDRRCGYAGHFVSGAGMPQNPARTNGTCAPWYDIAT